MIHRKLSVSLLLLLTGWTFGCGDGAAGSGTPGEIYDIPPTLEVSTEDDQQEVRRPPELSGQLPSDFPGDLPLYLPASLVDFGQSEDGKPWVEMLTPAPRRKVENELAHKVAEAGWRSQGGGVWQQGGRQVRFEIRDGQPGTVVRVVY